MKTVKRFTALVLALVMAAMLAVSAYAATVVVKYKVYVYTSQLTFKQLMMQAGRDSVADAGFHCNVCIVEDGGSLLIYVLYN